MRNIEVDNDRWNIIQTEYTSYLIKINDIFSNQYSQRVMSETKNHLVVGNPLKEGGFHLDCWLGINKDSVLKLQNHKPNLMLNEIQESLLEVSSFSSEVEDWVYWLYAKHSIHLLGDYDRNGEDRYEEDFELGTISGAIIDLDWLKHDVKSIKLLLEGKGGRPSDYEIHKYIFPKAIWKL